MAGRHRKLPPTSPGRHRKPPRRGHVVLPALAVAAVLGVGGVGAHAALGGGTPRHDAGAAARTLPGGAGAVALRPAPSAASSAASSPAPSPSAVARPNRPAPGFSITVTGRVSWVGVVAGDGKVLYAGMLRHGHTLTYQQRPLTVTLGDAGAVRLVLHHHASSPAGRRGEVLRFTVR